jgi:hypothetical protein
MCTLISQLAIAKYSVYLFALFCSFQLVEYQYLVSSSSSFFFKPDCSFQRISQPDRIPSDRLHNDHGGTTQTAALKLFKHADDGTVNNYEVGIPYPAQFSLVVAHVSRGVSFRQCADILADTKRILGTTIADGLFE